jgi:hypothetical protein
MLLSKFVKIPLISRNYKTIKDRYNLSSDLLPGDLAEIPIDNLSKSSHYLVDVSCDYCGRKLNVPYKRYNLNTKVIDKYACSSKECSNQKIKDVCQAKYGVDNPFQSDDVKFKSKETMNKKYGVDHPMYLQSTKDKIKNTSMDRYGVDSPMKSKITKDKIKNTCIAKYGVDHHSKTKEGQEKRKISRIKSGRQVPDELVSKYRKYRLSVNRITYSIRREVLNDWDGYDYYDGEYIRNNFELSPNDRNFPHLDHKISVIFGFYNDLDPKIIGGIDNVCVTKQWINGLKKDKCADEFIKWFKNK